MHFRELAVIVYTASQVFVLSASAGTQALPSPEFTLLQKTIALQGEALSPSDLLSQTSDAVSRYISTAPAQEQQQRMQQALVDMNIYSPLQAQSFVSDAQSRAQSMVGAEVSAEQTASFDISAEVAELTQFHPNGAEFSTCSTIGTVTGILGGIVLATGLTGIGLCSQPHAECYIVQGLNDTLQDVSYTGAAVLGVSALLIILSIENQC
jgi:hypothetical protein